MNNRNLTVLIVFSTLIIIILIYANSWRNRIVRRARKYIGNEEKAGNSGFVNPKFEEKMKAAGWSSGAQWCAYFVRLVYLESLHGKYKEAAKNLISGSSQMTWKKFNSDTSGLFEISDKPKRGAIVIWQSKTDTTKGHVGIVNSVINKDYFETIEGNSNNINVNLKDYKHNLKTGDDKDIIETTSESIVARHVREYSGNGMTLLGFINVK